MLLPTLEPALFLRRPNRFVAEVRMRRRTVLAHVPNTGRMRELLVEGRLVWVAPRPQVKGRATACDLVLVALSPRAGTLVSVDSRLPPRLIEEALAARRLASFRGYRRVERERPFGDSRLDLLLSGPRGTCYIEAKSCNRVERGVALFPDAVTQRGARHLRDLAAAVRAGHRAAAVFTIQRQDATSFATDPTDPDFGQAFRDALAAGVEAYAYSCRVTVREVILMPQPLPIVALVE
ncbi:MAG: DNA/RNA nuclease SfsA [Dehalococcoidia bacterium]|nr:DNA/RNA nuclease SfsA [Dehalococcoidia bacterium]